VGDLEAFKREMESDVSRALDARLLSMQAGGGGGGGRRGGGKWGRAVLEGGR
jgi:hypothetical protein